MKRNRSHIIRRILAGFAVAVYLLVALLNTSLVQSYLGAAASAYFTKEWGGKVRIGAVHVSPWSHVILDRIELVSPTNDTIYDGDRITCRFKHFPFHKGGLKFDRVLLRNGRYHFESIKYPSGKMGTNLDYIINYFATELPQPPSGEHFIVEVGELRLRNIDYTMDLPEPPGLPTYSNGVSIPHMRFLGTTAHIRKVRVDNDSITCRIVSLSTTECSGQHVVDLSMDVEVSPHVIRATNLDLQTEDSRVFLDAQLLYHGWEAMADYCNNVRHEVVIKEGTEVNLCDAAYWAPALWGINAKVAVRGHAYGPVADLHADNIHAAFGQNSTLVVDGSITGLPDIDNTTLDVAVRNLHTNYDDLASVRHPEPFKMILPHLVQQMGIIDIDATVVGGMRDCKAMFAINSFVGDLEGQAHLMYDSVASDFAYVGELDSRTLGLRSIVPNEWISRTGLHFSFQGTGFDPRTMDASLEGRLYNTNFRGRELERTTISADIMHQEVNADIRLKDTLINFDMSATADLVTHAYSADIVLQHAKLAALHLIQSDTDVAVTTRLQASAQGATLDELSGRLSLSNTHCQLGSRHVALDHLDLNVEENNGYKDVALNCDWALLTLSGYFQYAHVPMVVRDFCNRYLPVHYNPYRQADSLDLTPLYADNFDVDMQWKAPQGALSALVPGLTLAYGTTFHGSYNYAEALKLVFRSDSVVYNGISVNDLGFNTVTLGENYQLRAKAGSLNVGGSPLLDNVYLDAGLGSRISTLSLRWDDDAATVNTEGDLEFFLTSSPSDNKLLITKPTFYAMGQRWTMVCPDGILFNRDRLSVDNLKVYGLGQSASLKAYVAGNEGDYVKAAFNDFILDDICAAIIPGQALKVEGVLDGLFSLKGLHGTPYLDANLTVDNCVINGQPAGTVEIGSRYHADEKKLYADLVATHQEGSHDHHPLQIHGTALIEGNQPQLDFDLNLDQVELKTLGPAIAEVSSRIEGSVSGHVALQGTLSSPVIHGSLRVADGLLELVPTGVTYYFDDEFTIANNTLTLSDFAIRDKLGNSVLANGAIIISPDDILQLDLNLDTRRILVLDKEVNEAADFYGRLLAQVQGSVRGPVNSLTVQATASTLDGSEIYVPISNTRQVQENEFITFLSPDRTSRPSTPSVRRAQQGGVDLRANIHVTPGLKLHLPMDFDQLEANVNAVGRGDIQVDIHGSQPLDILGDYEFTSGSFSLALMQLITRNFTIQEGSTLNFPGNINEARFNISAVYNLRANLATLMGNYSSGTNDSYVQVQDIIKVSGTMEEPSIKFDIRLPNSEQSVSEQVFSYLDRNDELEMLNQSVSLLVLGQFTPTGASAATADNSINSVSLVANTAGSILTSLVKVVDVDFKYQASNSNLNPMGQFDVGISKSWNKLYFESTFGYGNVNSLDIDQSNTLVGDVKVGYRFTPYFNFYGFHRTNTSYYTRTELPYKQGLGVELSKDFESLHDLLPWLFKKEKTLKIE